MNKQFSSACERNADPILDVLRQEFASARHVLEIGSGTGQHAVHMAASLPHLIWQTSDLPNYHPSIQAWIDEAQLHNVRKPLILDMAQPDWPQGDFDAIFTANTCHIMSWDKVERMFDGAGRVLPAGGVLCVYGPFNIGGQYTSDGNARFDEALRAQSAHMGLRDLETVQALAASCGFVQRADHAMPANNRLLAWVQN
ncbi:DUF938 domain-containing protein [Oxalicibacterium faecigallinarum]|uniref:DUF938 domain-containing protein n=1 Tax=Oxalicibacterium faecigallinarum TaxID=573741 RepID=A0A8J3ASM0_9BURK|nr:DUF938 domain-containing protein [Oxalicibacterium faecigallinarum]GGI20808.1 hypothetical protein GCM10008066_25880 [Oxalicibacterium faecigallinarum]